MNMATKVLLIICALFLIPIIASAQRQKSTLLPESEAKRVGKQCSREAPPEFTETWQPSPEDLKKMESKLADIKKLKSKCCIEGEQIDNPEHFYMQYVGIVIRGKKLIYINAFADDKPPETWKEHAIIVCDGGVDWGVLYDPATGKFFDLSVNGIG
jgi:hypothetical protein